MLGLGRGCKVSRYGCDGGELEGGELVDMGVRTR